MRLSILADDHIRHEWTSMKDGRKEFVKVIDLYKQGT